MAKHPEQNAKPSVRNKIVDAAVERFHATGYNGTSVQDIVDKAEVPKGSFYNYFKTKELLALEVLEIYGKGSKREMLADQAISPLIRLRSHFEFMASRYAGFGYEKGCLIGNLAAEMSEHTPLLRDAIGRSLARWTEGVAAAIREGQSDRTIVSELDPIATARFLINSWEGAVIRMKIAASRQPIDDFFAIAFPMLTARASSRRGK